MWNDNWIKQNISNYEAISELWRAYKRECGECKQQAFRTHLKRKHGAYSRLTWTQEQDEWLRRNFPNMGGLKAVDEFNKVFGVNKSHRAIEGRAHRLNLKVAPKVVEANRRFPRRVPLETIKEDNNGYLIIKTGEGSSGWKRYHRYLWEKTHGELPKGYKVMFLDGDIRNFDKENLIAVPAKYFAWMNKLKLRGEDVEINLTAVRWCELYEQLSKQGYVMKNGRMVKK